MELKEHYILLSSGQPPTPEMVTLRFDPAQVCQFTLEIDPARGLVEITAIEDAAGSPPVFSSGEVSQAFPVPDTLVPILPRAGQPIAPPPSAIVITDLCKEFGRNNKKILAVDHLSLVVHRGEIFGLLGPNGSGKTTTINMLCGLLSPTSGSISIMGLDIVHRGNARWWQWASSILGLGTHRRIHEMRRLLGTVPQETALYDELRAWDNMEFHAKLYGVPGAARDTRITALLQLVGLLDRKDARVGTFSGGMKRRLAIARALLHNPQLVYLDEPTLGVDVQARAAIWDYIRELRRQGKTVLLTTNYLEEAQALCDRLAIIDHGRLIAIDTPDRLRQTYGGSVISIEVQAPDGAQALALTALRRLDGVSEVSLEQRSASPGVPHTGSRSLLQAYVVRILTRGTSNHLAEIVNLLSQQCTILDIAIRESSLDEVFLHLTGRALRD